MADHPLVAHETKQETLEPHTSARLGRLNVAVGNISLQDNSSGNFGYTHIENNYQSPYPISVRDECLQSLAFPQMRVRDNIRETPGTCKWILQHNQYQDWKNKGGILWVRGKPGAGKSTVMQHALEHYLQNGDNSHAILVGSFFFHRRGNELQYTRLGLFRSLLHQILSADEELMNKFLTESKFECRRKREGQPGKQWHWTEREIQTSLETYTEAFLQTRPICLYIDALDEAGESDARDILRQFTRLANKEKRDKPRLSICFSCRPYPLVMSGHDFLIDVEENNVPDIITFVNEEFKKAPAFLTCEDPALSRQDMALIKDELLNRASGVFQWISLVTIDILKLHGQRKNTIISRIKQIPEKLADLYEDMLGQIDENDRTLALQMCRWLSFACRPLSPLELHLAIAGDVPLQEHGCSKNWAGSEWEMEQRILRLSRGLARVLIFADSKPVVQFHHESINEYMAQRGIKFLEERCQQQDLAGSVRGRAHFIMSRNCLRYLDNDCSSASIGRGDKVEKPKPPMSFCSYALDYWASHARIAEAERLPQGDLIYLSKWPSNRLWAQLYTQDQTWASHERTTLEHIASSYELHSTLESLILHLDRKHDTWWNLPQRYVQHRKDCGRWNARDMCGRTPLSLAAEEGHIEVVKNLLNTGKVKADLSDFPVIEPWCLAIHTRVLWQVYYIACGWLKTTNLSWYRRCQWVWNARRNYGRTPLSYAAGEGHNAVVEQLLSTGKANAESRDGFGRTPLSYAASEGHEGAVRHLLSTGKVNADLEDCFGMTPLSYAAEGGHEGVVEQLLRTGKVNAGSKDSSSMTPLSYAASLGRDEVVRQLLGTRKVDVNTRDHQADRSSLYLAAEQGFDGIVKQLLCVDGIEVDAQDCRGRTPLWCATQAGHGEIVEQLLSTGKVDVDLKDRWRGSTPLSVAAEAGHDKVVKQLLDTRKVDPDFKDEYSRTPLSYAACAGHNEVVRLLLITSRVDLDSKDKYSRTPLLYAAGGGHGEVVRLLLSTDKVDPDLKDANDRTILSYVAEEGHDNVIRQLLSTGKVNPESKDLFDRTPLSYAAEKGHNEVVKQLLSTGRVDSDSKDEYGTTPLSYAAEQGHDEVVQQLLGTGKVDVNLQDVYGKSPLWYATDGRNDGVVKQLLSVDSIDVDSEGLIGTSLCSVARGGHEGLVKRLLDTGKVDVNFMDRRWERTPLWYAATNGHDKVVEQLLDTGKVDINSKDCDGETAFSSAIVKGHEKVIKLLQDYQRQVRR